MRTSRRWALAAEAGVLLVGAQLGIRLSGPRALMRRLGRAESYADGGSREPAVWRRARPIARCVDRVADRLPWRPACLPRALATRTMLRRRGIPCELHLGIMGTRPLAAHAWVTVGGLAIQRGGTRGITALATLR